MAFGPEAAQGPDPYVEDRRGIALLLQAADVIAEREQAQIQEQQNQLVGST